MSEFIVTGQPPKVQHVVIDGATAGGNAIVDGVDTTIKATVKDLTNSNPLAVEIVDANGDQITSFGSGTVTANAGTNLNTSALALETGGNLATVASAVRAEDTASADADKGIGVLAVRKATPANTSGTDGDYEYFQISAGRVWTATKLSSAVKTRTSLHSAVTLTAGAGNTTSSTIDLSAGYGAQVNFSLTNGATGPTVAAQVQIQVANDSGGTLFVNFGGALVGSVTNSAVTSWSVDIPPGVGAIKLVSGSNTAQNVTINADISVITSL